MQVGTFFLKKAETMKKREMESELKRVMDELRGCSSVGEGLVLPRPGTWVQGQQARVLKDFCAEIGLTPIRFHTLRACFATQLISDGVEPIKVMKVCGWMDLKTMARYVSR